MTEYRILIYEDARHPARVRDMGTYHAGSKEEAVRIFKNENSERELHDELDFVGSGSASVVAAVPESYFDTYVVDWQDDTIEEE